MLEGGKCIIDWVCLYTTVSCFRDEADPGCNDSVFSALLDDSQDIQVQVSTENVYILSDKDIILKSEETVSSLCVSHGSIAIATVSDNLYRVWLYKFKTPLTTIDLESRKYLTLPKTASTSSKKTHLKISYTRNAVDNGWYFSGCLELSTSLFVNLFGRTAALLQSPVCLFANPEGTIYFAPFAYFEILMPNSPPRSVAEHKDSMFPRWKNLCSVDSQVHDLFTLDVKQNSEEYFKQSREQDQVLAVCSSNSALTMFTRDTNNQTPITTSTINIPGPVQSLCCHGNKLYHSTSHHLYETSFVACSQSAASGCTGCIEVDKTKVMDGSGVVSVRVWLNESLNNATGTVVSISKLLDLNLFNFI